MLWYGRKNKHASLKFSQIDSLKEVSLPESLTDIGPSGFYGCTSLTEIVIPDGVKLGKAVFSHCTSLQEITLPADIERINDKLFNNCGFTEFTIPDGVSKICMEAFWGNKSLTKVVIPASVTDISPYCFEKCDNLTIYGESGSEAEHFANFNDIPFQALQ